MSLWVHFILNSLSILDLDVYFLPQIRKSSVAISSNNFMSLSLLLLGLYNGNAVLLDIEYPVPLIKRAWELGLMNTHIPESCGKLSLHF